MYNESHKKATYKYRENKVELRALVEEDIKKRVQEYCKKYSISQNELIRRAVEQYLDSNK